MGNTMGSDSSGNTPTENTTSTPTPESLPVANQQFGGRRKQQLRKHKKQQKKSSKKKQHKKKH